MEMILEWGDPPENGRTKRVGGRRDVWKPTITALKQHPGRWALIAKGATTGIGPSLKIYYGVEIVTRNNRVEDGRQVSDIWARWPMDVDVNVDVDIA